MLKKIRAFGVAFILVFTAACDGMPTEPEVRPQFAFWDTDRELWSAPVGSNFHLDQVHHNVIEGAATESQGTIAGVRQEDGAWTVHCLGGGKDRITIFGPDGTRDTVPLECASVDTIRGFLYEPTDLNAHLGESKIQVGLTGNARELWMQRGADSVKIECRRPGTYTHVAVDTDQRSMRWYAYECVQREPLPVPNQPRVQEVVNVSAAFRAQGRTVQALQVQPNDLATPVLMGGTAGSLAEASRDSLNAYRSVALDSTGDIGLRCERPGDGVVTVSFAGSEPNTARYSLSCHPAHDQGGGG